MRLLAILALGLASACTSSLQPLPTTVCHRAGAWEAETAPEEAAVWTSLLVDDEEGRRSSCDRALARTPPPAPRCERAPVTEPRRFAIPARFVAVSRRPGEDELVWVATHRMEDGSLSGPIAIVRHTGLGLEVQALGSHTGPAEQIQMRLLRAGGTTLIAVESSVGDARVADLLVQSGGALVPAALEDPILGCQAPARIVLRQSDERASSGGWRERRVRTATMHESATGFVVSEHLSIEEIDASEPDAPARARRESSRLRTLRPAGARLRADRGPIDADPAHATDADAPR